MSVGCMPSSSLQFVEQPASQAEDQGIGTEIATGVGNIALWTNKLCELNDSMLCPQF